ncbi:MAG: phospholipase D family protein [Gammaproteobacteria bacterium]|nr:phospholipase D family protein [Gammaproteobacteria bacterium]
MQPELSQALAPQILYTRNFQRQFARCIGHQPSRLDIVVPYVGKTPWGSVAQFFGRLLNKGCEIYLVTQPPSDKDNKVLNPSEARRIESMGVFLKIRTSPFLHSKVYQFSYPKGGRMSFVGSANLSMGGFERNDETVAFFQAKADNEKVAAEILRASIVGIPYYIYSHREAKNGRAY